MFKFKATTETYSDPISATFVQGIPFGPEFSKGDIAFLHEEFAGSKIFFNSRVLREAMLESKDFLEKALDIKITDARKAEPVKEVKKEEPAKVEELPTDQTGEEVTQEPEVEEKTEDVIEVFDSEDIPKEEVKKTTKKK